MSTDLINSLRNLKAQLDVLQVKTDSEHKQTLTPEQKLQSLLDIQDNQVITIEVGEKVFQTTLGTIQNFKFDNLLKDQIGRELKYGKLSKVYHVEMNPKIFKKVLNLMRTYNVKNYSTFHFVIDQEEKFVRRELEYFFKNRDEVFSIINLKRL